MISSADKCYSCTHQVKHFLPYLRLAVTQWTPTQIPRHRPLQCCPCVVQRGHFVHCMTWVAAHLLLFVIPVAIGYMKWIFINSMHTCYSLQKPFMERKEQCREERTQRAWSRGLLWKCNRLQITSYPI